MVRRACSTHPNPSPSPSLNPNPNSSPSPNLSPTLTLSTLTRFEDLQPTLLAAAEAAGLRLVGVSEDAEAGAAVLEIRWSTLANRGYGIPV